MKTYLKYTISLLRHKWFVLLECLKWGMPIVGISHDMSKFTRSEFSPYANYFYGFPDMDAFREAWYSHIKHNPHHWQHWLQIDADCCQSPRILVNDDDGVICLNCKKIVNAKLTPIMMPPIYLLEMVCDWVGAGKAYRGKSVDRWYMERRDKIILHPVTRMFVEVIIGVPHGNSK